MRNLLRFLWKYSNFVLFILMEVFCFYLVFQNNSFQKAGWINSSNAFAGNVFTTVNSIKEYFALKETNELLAAENARLRNQSLGSFAKFITTKTVINDTVIKQQYTYIPAEVVNNSVNRRNNYLTLNRGYKQGITNDMAVISSNGIIGYTKDVSANFCTVLSILNKDAKISAKIKRYDELGSLIWEGGDYRFGLLQDIGTHVKIAKGDTIVTSNFSDIFPSNIIIGTVESFVPREGGEFYNIKVKYSANLKNITHVYIINNILREEKKILEERSQHD
ncbi:MAG TPA: rod shape-determining protein MreC [Bacteroidia bacterium]|nr:rod shape-determining protein MreC [Bacteroidia bacterium]